MYGLSGSTTLSTGGATRISLTLQNATSQSSVHLTLSGFLLFVSLVSGSVMVKNVGQSDGNTQQAPGML